jgi:hypothetical protein
MCAPVKLALAFNVVTGFINSINYLDVFGIISLNYINIAAIAYVNLN